MTERIWSIPHHANLLRRKNGVFGFRADYFKLPPRPQISNRGMTDKSTSPTPKATTTPPFVCPPDSELLLSLNNHILHTPPPHRRVRSASYNVTISTLSMAWGTGQNGNTSNTALFYCVTVSFFAILFFRRFSVSPFWSVAVLDVSPF